MKYNLENINTIVLLADKKTGNLLENPQAGSSETTMIFTVAGGSIARYFNERHVFYVIFYNNIRDLNRV